MQDRYHSNLINSYIVISFHYNKIGYIVVGVMITKLVISSLKNVSTLISHESYLLFVQNTKAESVYQAQPLDTLLCIENNLQSYADTAILF